MKSKWNCFLSNDCLKIGEVALLFWKKAFESHSMELLLHLCHCLWAGKWLCCPVRHTGQRQTPAQHLAFISGDEVGSVVYSMLSWDVVYPSVYALPALLTTARQEQLLWSHRVLVLLVEVAFSKISSCQGHVIGRFQIGMFCFFTPLYDPIILWPNLNVSL